MCKKNKEVGIRNGVIAECSGIWGAGDGRVSKTKFKEAG